MKINVIDGFPPIKDSDISQIEQEMGIRFPTQYIKFLLAQNGGYPLKGDFSLPDQSDKSAVNYFYPVGNMTGNLINKNDIFDGDFPEEFISIACDPGGNQILLRVKGEKIGEIYFWYHDIDPDDEDPMHFLANSLSEFLSMLEE